MEKISVIATALILVLAMTTSTVFSSSALAREDNSGGSGSSSGSNSGGSDSDNGKISDSSSGSDNNNGGNSASPGSGSEPKLKEATPAKQEENPKAITPQATTTTKPAEQKKEQPTCMIPEGCGPGIPNGTPMAQQGGGEQLPKCDGSFQDCVTRNGDKCKAGQGGHECECADDMHDCQKHPSILFPVKTKTGTPDASCDFHPNADKCKPDAQGNCPPGFSHNDKGNCHPSGPCPTGFFRHTDDESGKCFHKRIHGHHDNNNHNANNNNPTHTLKCDNEHDSCIGFCSTANLKGTETTFCFTKKECEKFREENHGTECKRTVIHD